MYNQSDILGVSIVICCYNSSSRLSATLSFIKSQNIPEQVHCEVIVVDNASQDDTTEVAYRCWSKDSRLEMRVVREPSPGLSQARLRGIAESKYELVSFIDDDNWVCDDWVAIVTEVMSSNPMIGACGGFSEPVSNMPLPEWFDRVKGSYAVGSQAEQTGEIHTSKGLWGAGLTLRKQAWADILEKGFAHLCSDRKGDQLISGGDTELSYALRLAGWKLWYDSRLRFQHFLPDSRLSWEYLRRLHRGFGASSVLLDPYLFRFGYYRTESSLGHIKKTWAWQLINVIRSLAKTIRILPRFLFSRGEGDSQLLGIEFFVGRLLGMIKRPFQYRTAILEIERKYPQIRFLACVYITGIMLGCS